MSGKSAALFLALGLFFYGTGGNVFAYDELTTHPALTDEIVNFYNLSYPENPVTPEERELIVRGSTLEDTPPRWINHFYDPVHNIAWTGENTGWLSEDVVRALRLIGLSTEEPLTSVDWVNNRIMQERYSLYGGDRTWAQGLDYYVEGNKNEAYHTLGYSLHLLEDATVPEHTRNDPHAHALEGATGDYGSPYEEYTKKWTRETIGGLQIANGLKNSGAAPAARASIEEYITAAAQYSNKYFFTKDTINSPDYEFPKIIRDDGNFGYGLDENNLEFPLAKTRNVWNEQEGHYEITYEILEKPAYYPILDAYFSRLSRKAVIEGAGAIKLFKDQATQRARDAEVNAEFPNRLVVLDPEIAKWLNLPTFSLVGELYKAWSATEEFLSDFGGMTIAIYDKFIATVGPGQTTVAPRSPSTALGTGDSAVTDSTSSTSSWQASSPQASTSSPAPVTASPTVSETIATNPEPSNPTSSITASSASPNSEVAGTSTSNTEANTPIVWGVSSSPSPTGGVSISGGSPSPGDGGETPSNSSTTGELPDPLATITGFLAAFDLNDLEIDFSWNAIFEPSPVYLIKKVDGASSTIIASATGTSATSSPPGYGATFTYSIEAQNASGTAISHIATTAVSVPDLLFDFETARDEESHWSWYSDNWYNLGTGFYGTIYALIFDGYVAGGNSPDTLYPSTILIQEYLDHGYSALNREFVVSQGTDFTREPKEVVIKGLNIPLQPNKFYRLLTANGLQNAYVALSGTSNTGLIPTGETYFRCPDAVATETGSAMWNEFVYGTGCVAHIYPFHPFLWAVMQENFPEQSAPTSPAMTAVDFDGLNLRLAVNWAISTDADTTDNLVRYEFNYSSSTNGPAELSPDSWAEVSIKSFTIPLEFPKSYTIGVRAKDDFGNTSAPTIINWNFPDGFSPSILSNPFSTASQEFVLSRGGRVTSVKVYTDQFIQGPNRYEEYNVCWLDLYEVGDDGSTTLLAQNDTPAYSGHECAGNLEFTFASMPEIAPQKKYRWVFHIDLAGSVKFWGKLIDTAGGLFSDPSIVNAKFAIESDSGTLFSN